MNKILSNSVKQTLLTLGFRVFNSGGVNYNPTYIKRYLTKDGCFNIKLEIIDADLVSLPKAYLLEVPEKFKALKLPHVNSDMSLCYLDPESTTWNILDGDGFFVTIDSLLKNFIELIIKGEWKNEFIREFPQYWNGRNFGFLSSENKNFHYTKYKIKDSYEYLAYDNKEQMLGWINDRNGIENTNENKGFIIEIKKLSQLNLDANWPACTLSDLFKWLSNVDCIAYQQLIQKIIHHINDQEKFLFILEVNKSFIGFEVEFSRKLNAQLSRFKKTKFKIEHASNVIKNKLNVMRFNRISILDARNSFIYTRNNKEKKDFRGLKIALIGCGAIGSFVAKQLAASGAGLSSIKQGELYLYDDDILQPGNLGRHALGIEYLLKNKAIATKEHINKSNSQLIIHALSRKFNENDFNNNFDFVIDCTAKETSSTAISKWFISSGKKITKVCHGWIDAYGDAARSLIYDSNGPCYSCLNIYSDNVIIPRFPLFNKEKSNNIEYFGNNCGSTYMYYDSSACLMASSLIIRNIYNYLNGNSENFLHVGLTNEIKKTNNKILKKINGCPLCQ